MLQPANVYEDHFTQNLSEKFRFMQLAAKHKDFTELSFITHHVATELEKLDSLEVNNHIDLLVAQINSKSASILREVKFFIARILDALGLGKNDLDL